MNKSPKTATKAFVAKNNSQSHKAQNSNLVQSRSVATPADHIMFLQRTIGNQAVQRMLNKSAESKEHGAKSRVQSAECKVQSASRITPCAERLAPCAIQPKLKIGQLNDIYEQEADRVADQVMRMPEKQHIADSSLRSIADSPNLLSISHKPLAIRHTPYAIRHTLSEDESVQRKPT